MQSDASTPRSCSAAPKAIVTIIIAIVLAVCLLCMLCFVSASLIARTLGRTGNAVLSRVLGMLFAAYSVQFVINGIAAVRASLSLGCGNLLIC
ncbi:small neutral amino acid transporter SnatA (MarC family) [Bradyrhizobium sp. S3.12.5]